MSDVPYGSGIPLDELNAMGVASGGSSVDGPAATDRLVTTTDIAEPFARIAQALERIAAALEPDTIEDADLDPATAAYFSDEPLPVCDHEGFRDSDGMPVNCTKTVGHDGLHGWSDLYTWGAEGVVIRTGLSIRREPPTDPPINCATG